MYDTKAMVSKRTSWAIYTDNEAQTDKTVQLMLLYPKPCKHFPLYEKLPVEIKIQILRHAVVARYPLVDPGPPIGQRLVCDQYHPHASLSSTFSPTYPFASHVRTEFPRRHDLQSEMSKQARSAIESTHGPIDEQEEQSKVTLQILRANKQSYELGMRELYEHTKCLFTSPATLQCFIDRYPKAAHRVNHITFIMALNQIAARSRRIVTDTNQDGPWFSKSYGTPSLVDDVAMLGNSGVFCNLKSITIHVLDWEQSEEKLGPNDGRVPSPPNATPAGRAPSVAPISHMLLAANPSLAPGTYVPHQNNHVSIIPQIAQSVLAVPSFYAPTRMITVFHTSNTKPVRVVDGADIHGWIAMLAGVGWKAKEAYVTGMEALEDQGYVDQLRELLTKTG